jgi:phosphate starvation-inducible PhoH-like protein
MSHLELTLEPINNDHLANLCGPLDDHLKTLEQIFGCRIQHRNHHFKLLGSLEQTHILERHLIKLYQQATDPLSEQDLYPTPEPNINSRSKFSIKGRTARQLDYIKKISEHTICFGVGPAGTGKTYLAVACALEALEHDEIKRIILIRPAVEAGEKLGFLPGDQNQKVDPYLRPLHDALYDIAGFDRIQKLMSRNIIEVAPLAYMRGRTLDHSFIILDEAQNTTPEQMKMFLTRLGFGSRAVITGDVTQIDLNRSQKSGLIEARFILQNIPEIGFVIFQGEDVVRHPIVQKVIEAYDKYHNLHPHSR